MNEARALYGFVRNAASHYLAHTAANLPIRLERIGSPKYSIVSWRPTSAILRQITERDVLTDRRAVRDGDVRTSPLPSIRTLPSVSMMGDANRIACDAVSIRLFVIVSVHRYVGRCSRSRIFR